MTSYQDRYSASASAILQGLKVGVTPVLLGAAFVRMSSLLEPGAPAASAATRLLSLVQGVMHLVLVDMLLFDLKHLGSAGGVHVQLALIALAWLRPTERSAPSRPTTWPHRPSSRGCHRCWL